MADEISRMWGNFTLTEEEGIEVVAPEEVLSEIVLKGQLCLVGKLLADRMVGKESIRSKLILGWRPTGSISFKALGENLFLIEFEYSCDKDRVLEGRPWGFEGSLFAVADFDGVTPPNQMNFDTAAFWVRMYNLPLACMGREMGMKLGFTVGFVDEVDVDIDGMGWGEFLE